MLLVKNCNSLLNHEILHIVQAGNITSLSNIVSSTIQHYISGCNN